MKFSKSAFNKLVSSIRFDEKELTVSEKLQYDVESSEYYETQAQILIQEAAEHRKKGGISDGYRMALLKACRLLLLAIIHGNGTKSL